MDVLPPEHDPRPIYVGFSTTDQPMSRLIRWLTRGDVSHVFIAHWSHTWRAWLLLGSDLSGGWSYKSVPQLLHAEERRRRKRGRLVSLYRMPRSLWPGLVPNARWLGAGYDVRGLVGMGIVMAAWQFFRRRVRNPFGVRRRWFCSEIVAQVIRDAGMDLRLDPGSTDPERLEQAIAALDGVQREDPSVLLRPPA